MRGNYDWYEFFAGGGMARLGLGSKWNCAFANDWSDKKEAAYRQNFPNSEEFVNQDIAKISTSDLPGNADLAWASFPCQDLSLAGDGRGLKGERSGTFWPFWQLMDGLRDEGRQPRLVVLENVVGTITSHGGEDFAAIVESMMGIDYRVGAMVIDAVRFVPQSRPRLFIVCAHKSVDIADSIPCADVPNKEWHTQSLVEVVTRTGLSERPEWVWWSPSSPRRNVGTLADHIEDEATGVRWHPKETTDKLLAMMSPVNRRKVTDAQKRPGRQIGTIYRRTRPDGNGHKVQRAEVRFDGISGCLRTPAGGSSRQVILVVERSKIRSRLLSVREAARLMGVRESYRLPENYNEGYHLMGDGLVVPAVRWLKTVLLEPLLKSQSVGQREAA